MKLSHKLVIKLATIPGEEIKLQYDYTVTFCMIKSGFGFP